jgi:hypothetical protein
VETRLGTLKFADGFPDDDTVQKVYENLDFINGVNAFLNAMGGASTEAIRTGFASLGADHPRQCDFFFQDQSSGALTQGKRSVQKSHAQRHRLQ